MNFINILRAIFKQQPCNSLEDYINLHKPTSTIEVERLERQYMQQLQAALLK